MPESSHISSSWEASRLTALKRLNSSALLRTAGSAEAARSIGGTQVLRAPARGSETVKKSIPAEVVGSYRSVAPEPHNTPLSSASEQSPECTEAQNTEQLKAALLRNVKEGRELRARLKEKITAREARLVASPRRSEYIPTSSGGGAGHSGGPASIEADKSVRE